MAMVALFLLAMNRYPKTFERLLTTAVKSAKNIIYSVLMAAAIAFKPPLYTLNFPTSATKRYIYARKWVHATLKHSMSM